MARTGQHPRKMPGDDLVFVGKPRPRSLLWRCHFRFQRVISFLFQHGPRPHEPFTRYCPIMAGLSRRPISLPSSSPGSHELIGGCFSTWLEFAWPGVAIQVETGQICPPCQVLGRPSGLVGDRPPATEGGRSVPQVRSGRHSGWTDGGRADTEGVAHRRAAAPPHARRDRSTASPRPAPQPATEIFAEGGARAGLSSHSPQWRRIFSITRTSE